MGAVIESYDLHGCMEVKEESKVAFSCPIQDSSFKFELASNDNPGTLKVFLD